MTFNEILATLPAIDGLTGLDVMNGEQLVHHIPAIQGKLGSLRLYNALAAQFDGQLNAKAAQQGLQWFAEHVQDARVNPGKHPNIDLLFHVVDQDLSYQLVVKR